MSESGPDSRAGPAEPDSASEGPAAAAAAAAAEGWSTRPACQYPPLAGSDAGRFGRRMARVRTDPFAPLTSPRVTRRGSRRPRVTRRGSRRGDVRVLLGTTANLRTRVEGHRCLSPVNLRTHTSPLLVSASVNLRCRGCAALTPRLTLRAASPPRPSSLPGPPPARLQAAPSHPAPASRLQL